MPEDRVRELRGGRERLEVVPERAREEVVHGRQHLWPRPVVAPQLSRFDASSRRSPEHPDVRVPEPVDRLELVPDREDLRHFRMRDEVDELALEQVRVLELVDHHDAEAQPRRLAHLLVVPKQIASSELEVLEVDDRLAPLRERVLGGEALQQLLEKHAIGRRELFQRGLLERLAGVLVRGGACSAALERRQVDDALGAVPSAAILLASAALLFCVSVALASSRRQAASVRSAVSASSKLGRSPSSRTSGRPAERSVS